MMELVIQSKFLSLLQLQVIFQEIAHFLILLKKYHVIKLIVLLQPKEEKYI